MANVTPRQLHGLVRDSGHRHEARAKAFYDAVFLTDLQEDNTGPNPMAMFPIKDMKTGHSGHLYPGKPASGGKRQHSPPRRAGAARGRARARRQERRQGRFATSSTYRQAASPIASIPTGTASASCSPLIRIRCAAPTASSRSSSISGAAGLSPRERFRSGSRFPSAPSIATSRTSWRPACRSMARPASATSCAPASTCRR